jgi:hypothetical protein
MSHLLRKRWGVVDMSPSGADKHAGSPLPEAQIRNDRTVSAKWWAGLANLDALVSGVSPLMYLLVYISLIPLFAALYYALPSSSFFAPYARLEYVGQSDAYVAGVLIQMAIRRTMRGRSVRLEDRGNYRSPDAQKQYGEALSIAVGVTAHRLLDMLDHNEPSSHRSRLDCISVTARPQGFCSG